MTNFTRFTIRFLLNLALLISISAEVFPQAGSYYNSISTSSSTFVTDLKNRIRSPYTRVSYDNFDETNIANFASIDNGNGTRSVFCVYSGYEYIYTGTFTWTTMSREHTFPHSWMPTFPSTSNDQYSDQHHLFPTHQNNANNRRSNHPFGEVVNITYQFLEGKLGTNSNGDIVYEPREIHKGDAARALLYMCVRYDGISGNTWNFNWLNNTQLPGLGEDPQSVNLLLAWHNQDPPDKWEVDRNNYVQSIQQNRNPFVDHPEYVNFINFDSLVKLNPVYAAEPSGYVTSLTSNSSGSSIQLNWNDATGAQLPSGYLIIAYNRNSYFLPIDGSAYNNDTVLADGFGIVNVPFANANTYSFSNLTPNVTYYFSVFSYNGTGSQINYKIDGTFPVTNQTVPSGLATEPSNHLTGFFADHISSSSMQLNWTDALPGSQSPSGYLLIANNNNSFFTPSDGVVYANDTNISDGSAVFNITYSDPDNFVISNLTQNTQYYYKMYSYNGSSAQRNYKTDGSVPYLNAATSTSSQTFTSVLFDNFNRANNNIVGNSLPPEVLPWVETETVSPSSVNINNNRLKSGSTVAGRDVVNANVGSVSGYPVQLKNSSSQLMWAFNLRQSRTDPSGFDAGNYGIAFILGKTTSDISTGNGYAVVLGQSGGSDAIRLAKFTGGVNLNSKFANIISGGDYSNQYLSIKVIYEPAGNLWTLFVDSSSSGFPQIDPRNSSTQISNITADSTYTSASLQYLGTMWNHNTSSSDSASFDEIYIPGIPVTTINITSVIEGHFDAGASKLNIRDTTTAFLRNSTAPYSIIDSSRAVIDSVSFTGTFSFTGIATGNYYIELKHRNALETWSKTAQSIVSGSTFNYDFTTSAAKAFGDNLIQKNGKYCIFSGDVNQDGIIDASDISDIDNDANNFISGYSLTDLTGDMFTDASDLSIADNNAFSFIQKVTP